jgi:LL-diaminopimelate aminotransferase
VAVEFRSFSKRAGFTGTRCAYTVVPEECRAFGSDGAEVELHGLWNRRQATKFNGVSYPVQCAAAASYTNEGRRQVDALADYYLENARIIRENLNNFGFSAYGGIHSPYIWAKSDALGGDSWSFFDRLLEDARVVCTPGSGFGRCGEGFVRFSAFNDREAVEEAMERIGKIV